MKIVLGINILNFASRRFIGMDARRSEDDEVNDFARPPLGEGEDEKVSLHMIISPNVFPELTSVLMCRRCQEYNQRLRSLLDRDRDDLRVTHEIRTDDGTAKAGGKKKKLTIEEGSRWTMV